MTTQSLVDLHTWWAWVVVVGNGLAGAWALAAHRWEGFRRPVLWWFTGAVQTAIAVQVVLGVVLVSGRDQVAPFESFLAPRRRAPPRQRPQSPHV